MIRTICLMFIFTCPNWFADFTQPRLWFVVKRPSSHSVASKHAAVIPSKFYALTGWKWALPVHHGKPRGSASCTGKRMLALVGRSVDLSWNLSHASCVLVRPRPNKEQQGLQNWYWVTVIQVRYVDPMINMDLFSLVFHPSIHACKWNIEDGWLLTVQHDTILALRIDVYLRALPGYCLKKTC